LAEFSGYIAIDELYDGPFCVLSLVDMARNEAELMTSLGSLQKEAMYSRIEPQNAPLLLRANSIDC
jgi:hypothetical protein